MKTRDHLSKAAAKTTMLRQSLGSELQLSAEGVFVLYLTLQDIERDIAEAERLLKKENSEQ